MLIRLGVFLGACAFLWIRIGEGQGTLLMRGGWGTAVQMAQWPVWVALLGLGVLNWGIEALKWRWLVAPVERMGMGRAFSATLAGTATGLLTPNRTGEPLGRVLFLAPQHRWQGGMATVMGSLAQLVTTVVLGGVAYLVWCPQVASTAGQVLFVLVVAGTVAAPLFYFNPKLLRRMVMAVPVLRRLGTRTEVLETYTSRKLFAVWMLSVARYAVFAFQYILLLAVLAGVPWAASATAVPVIFLLTTLVPTMVLTELGVRGGVAVAVLASHGGEPALVLLASFGVWLANIALPAAVGAVIIVVARIQARA